MLGKIKDAARQAMAERQIRDALRGAGLLNGASVTFRPADGQLRATVLLAEGAPLSGADAKALEAQLTGLDAVDAVTLVTTAHQSAEMKASATPAPTDDQVRAGHENPLGLPGSAPVKDEDRQGELRARPQRQRPGGASRVIAVASGKGGVGKSTLSVLLAKALVAKGERVGLLDLDIYGPSLPVMFDLEGVRPKVENGQVIPLNAAGLSLMSIGFLVDEEQALAWRGPMVMGAAKQLLDQVAWGGLDTLIIDTPPGTGDAHITLMQRTRIDGAVLVSTPSPLALADVRRGASLFQKMNVPLLGLAENMATLPNGDRPFGPEIDIKALVDMGVPRLGSLPLDPALARIAGPETSPIPDAISALVAEIEGRLLALDHGDDAP